jgi:4-hydroxy-tetrahydrodipicolinate reductase
MTIRVGVFGAGGKMGATVCAAIGADPDLDLVAAVDPYAVGRTILGVEVAAGPKAMADAEVQVAIDFTVLEAARTNITWCGLHGIHALVGTTGFTPEDMKTFGEAFTRSNCMIVPNFAISAVLMMRFAELAAPFFESAEVIELHHDAKADAPSGTAVRTVERIAAASAEWAPDKTRNEVYPGARGGVGPAGIHVHSVRMRGLEAHQEVLFGTRGQTLIIRQDSYDRESYLPGILMATKRIAEKPGVTVGLDSLLGF